MGTKRLDIVVADKTNTSRAFASKLIGDKKVRLGLTILDKPSKRIDEQADIEIDFNANILYPDIDIKIIYEDSDCIVIDKPAGVLTHSKGAFNPEATVATWLHSKVSDYDNSDQRSGIVHRLDRGTSGVMVLAKNSSAQKFFQLQFSKRNVKKTYVAVIEGELIQKKALIDIPIIRNSADPKRFKLSTYGKPAQTSYNVTKTFSFENKRYSLVELQPKTGRTHQIRLHLKHLGKPIVGDDFYGGVAADRLYLHAINLELTLPDSSREKFTSPIPDYFLKPKLI